MNAVAEPALSLEDFELGDIDGEQFDHQSHVYVAWLYVQKFKLCDAIEKFDAALQRLVIKLGAEGKYHATMTWFFILLIAERSNSGDSWTMFCANNPDLLTNGSAILSRYYTDKVLFSDDARALFLLPNKLALVTE